MKTQSAFIKVAAVVVLFGLFIGSSLATSPKQVGALQATSPAIATPDASVPPANPLIPCTSGMTGPCDFLATKAADIVGIWKVYFVASPAYIRYKTDGTWLIADTVEHTNGVSAEGYPFGTFSFDKTGVFTSLDPNTPSSLMPEQCRGGRYILHIIKVNDQPVALNHVVVDDCFAPRRTDWAYAMLWVGSK
jgi:hypothetical protein